MSTDKTLADVQPGGRVRLGDQLVLAKLVGAAGLMLAEIDTCGHEVDPAYRHTLYEAWEEGKAALSAQPSPGGQGDALLDQARKLFDELGAIADDDKCVAILAAALAARQPVGEPAYNSAGISLTACQLHEALLMAGDPELDVPFEDRSLVRIFWTETGHSGPGLYCECVGAEEEGCILLDGTAPAIGQSAQAVDLPYSLDADQAGIRARVCDVITGTLMVGAQGHTPPPAGHWAEPFWKAARADAAAQAVDLERFRPAVMTALGLSSPYGLERETLNGLLDLIDSHGARNG